MNFQLFTPDSLSEAIRLQQLYDAKYLAGGTVLIVNYGRGTETHKAVVSLEKLPGMYDITESEASVSVGSLVSCDMLERSDVIRKYFFALWKAASEVGGPQIRHRATIGGNIAAASPSSDLTVPLLALNAALQVTGAAGSRSIPLTEFFLGRFRTAIQPDEIITAVVIPKLSCVSGFTKVGKRDALSVSCINMGYVKYASGQIRAAVGAAAPRPVFCAKTSALLTEGKFEDARAALQTEISPIDDRWGTAEYRRTVADNLLRNYCEGNDCL